MKKRRVSLKLRNDEAAVIASTEFWDYLEMAFNEMSEEDSDNQESWVDAANHIATWVERTRFKEDYEPKK